MSARLVVIAGPDQGKAFPLSGGTLVVGRGRTAEVQLADPHVSRSHCQVQIQGGRAVVKDLDSAGGIFVNDSRVESQTLRPGDVIRLGSTVLRLEASDLADQATLAPPDLPARAAPAAALPRPAAPPPLPPRPQSDPAATVHSLTGKTVSHFRIGPAIAPGKSGVVYRATDSRGGKPVAIKVFGPEFAKDEEELQRFLRAMKTMLPLRHPHLAAVQGAGRSGPLCWVAMEMVEGPSLAPAVAQAAARGGDWRIAFRVLLHVGRVLAYLHAQSIYHRNITPNNVLLNTADGVVKVGDLMTAKAQEGRLARDVTQAGELLGDVRFLSPEQTSGAGEGDGRADLYSLGATAYAVLTGRPPVEGRGPVDTILKIRQVVPLPPGQFAKDIPPAFEATIMRLLAKRPEDRFASAGDLLGHLGTLATGGLEPR